MTKVIYKTIVVSYLSLSGLLIDTKVNAQDAGVGTLPMMYNGGFAGEAGAPRLASFSYFRERSTYSNGARLKDYGTFLSYDTFLKKIRSGVGLTAGRFYSGNYHEKDFENTSVALAISPKFSYKGKITVAPFADFTFIHSSVSPHPEPTVQSPFEFTKTNFRGVARAGFLINTNHAYLGLSTQVWQLKDSEENALRFDPRQGVFNSSFNAYLQTGYTFQRTPESKFSFTPQLVVGLRKLGFGIGTKVYIRDLSLGFRYNKLIWGLSRNGFTFGYQDKAFKLQASYYSNYTTLSLRYTFRKNKAENPKFIPGKF